MSGGGGEGVWGGGGLVKSARGVVDRQKGEWGMASQK
jgi:hypothetical protein